jgi:HSP20 family protein
MALSVRRSDEALPGDPLAGLAHLNRQLQDYLNNWSAFAPMPGDGFVPLADMEETDDAFIVEIELPGVKPDEIDIEIAGPHLTVTGERKERKRTGTLRRQTRTTGRFRFEAQLPSEVVNDGVEADLSDGVLTMRVPKPAAERSRRIPVN